MNKTSLNALDFKHSHDIVLNVEGSPVFKVINNLTNVASVYMWVTPLDDESYTVLYIGKAGYGVRRRMEQHAGGFRNSSTGRTNCALLTELLRSGRQVHVFGRVAKIQSVMGVEVSLYSVEEEALCDLYSPLWNRARFPSNNLMIEDQPLANKQRASHDHGIVARQRLLNSSIELINEIDIHLLPRGEELQDHIATLEANRKTDFVNIIKTLTCFFISDGIEQKIVRGYSNQPSGYNNKPMMVFCRRTSIGRAVNNGWYARVPLTDSPTAPMTVFLNRQSLLDNISYDLFNIEGDYFIPKNLKDFLERPALYLKNIEESR